MKIEEEVACKFLEQQGLGTPVFEPDGNISPDFVLSQRIAVEVRRLNRIFSTDDLVISEESIYIPFRQILEDVLRAFDSQYNNKSYWVGIEYVTPFSPSKSTRKELTYNLEAFLTLQDIELPYRLKINDGVALIIFEAKPIAQYTFKIVGGMHLNVPPIVQLYVDNLQWCIIEKNNKIEPHKHKYPEWQLLLIDSLQWSLGIEEIERIKASMTDLGLFDSLSVIDYDAKLIFRK